LNSQGVKSFQTEEAERYWFAFILYSIKRLAQKNEESRKGETENTGLTLCRILRAAKLKYFSDLYLVYKFVVLSIIYSYVYLVLNSVPDFFKELPQFVVKAGPILSNLYGSDWENRLEVLTRQRITIVFFLS
jgi:retinoblastoma-like protein 1